MSPKQNPRRVPQVNLLRKPAQGMSVAIPRRYLELLLVACAIAIWGAVAVGIALLVGWQLPHFGGGP
jgi:hypothetical protein